MKSFEPTFEPRVEKADDDVNEEKYIDLDTEEDLAKYIDALNNEEDIARCIDTDRCIDQLESIENEIVSNHNFIRDSYRSKFGDLECLLPRPLHYALLAKAMSTAGPRLEEVVDRTSAEYFSLPCRLKEDLSDETQDRLVKVFKESPISRSWEPLPEDVLQMTMDACDRVIALDSEKKMLFDVLTSKVVHVAPNLCEVVGSGIIAAKLMAAAGALTNLANMPASEIEVLGRQKSDNISFYEGYLESTEMFQATTLCMRERARQLLAEKLKEAASVDLKRGDVSGSAGRALRDEILGTIEYEIRSPKTKFQLRSSIPERRLTGPRMRRTIDDEIEESYALYPNRKRRRG